MTNVGNVHNTLHIVANVAQCLLQYVLHDVGTQIADMGIVIHRGATSVHLNKVGVTGLKQLLFVRKRIVQIHNIPPKMKNPASCAIQEAV